MHSRASSSRGRLAHTSHLCDVHERSRCTSFCTGVRPRAALLLHSLRPMDRPHLPLTRLLSCTCLRLLATMYAGSPGAACWTQDVSGTWHDFAAPLRALAAAGAAAHWFSLPSGLGSRGTSRAVSGSSFIASVKVSMPLEWRVSWPCSMWRIAFSRVVS